MVSLIIHENRRIDRELFLEGVQKFFETKNKPVSIRIITSKCGKIELKNGICHYIDLFVEIREPNFTCEAYAMQNGVIDKKQTQKVNATFETIKMRFRINKHDRDKISGDPLYKFETDHILFSLVNHGLIKKEIIQRGNHQGIQHLRAYEISNALKGLDVGIIVTEEHGVLRITAKEL